MTPRTIHDVFSSIAGRWPQKAAVLCDRQRLTYAELERRSNRIARCLQERGAGPGDRIGLFAQRSVDAVAALLGILKVGAAYVPFDPAYPPKLLKYVYDDCAPLILLVQASALAENADPFWSGAVVTLENALAQSDAPQFVPSTRAMSTNDPAYIMYTSGSTGHPKGVTIAHRGVVRLVIDNTFARMDADQVHLLLAPLAFDASTFEIWGALLNGGTLAVLPAQYPSLDEIAAAIAHHGVTTLWLTAGLFHLMVDQRLDGLKPLRQLIAGGDVLSPPHVERALRGLPDCQLINGYGPTENTTFTCTYRIPRDFGPRGEVPIGTPIAHTQVYILDEALIPTADGTEGELFAGGEGVALGYLNLPALTAERFLRDPFAVDENRVMYRTGDRVRRRPDGNIEFVGRVDRQVKINGKRVELDEIEAALRRSARVQDAAVTTSAVTTAAAAGTPRKILAYVTPGRDPIDIGELRNFLRQELPAYMMPASFTVLESLPLSPSGKVDRTKLPPPALAGEGAAGRAAPPATALEAVLLDIWRQVLGNELVGVDDNFFDLGGTSLQFIQVHARIVSVIATELTVIDMFQFPRISALAAWLGRRGSAAAVDPNKLTAAERAQKQQAALARARSRPRSNAR